MKLFTRVATVCGLIATLGATTAFAQAPTSTKTTIVHGYTRKGKNGKIITVKSYTRTAGPKKTANTAVVKSYTRKGKNGKIVTVKSYKRTVTKMHGMHM